MRALVLAGGGAKAAWQAGVISVLWEVAEASGDPYRIVSGTSAGAINAASLVQDRNPTRMLELWRDLTPSRVYRARGWVFGDLWRGLRALRGDSPFYDSSPLVDLIRSELDARRIEDSDRELLVHAFDIDARRQVTFRNRGPHARAILRGVAASMALPGLFALVDWYGAQLCDGGLVANVPIRSVVEAGASRVDVVTLDPGPPIQRAKADDSEVLAGGSFRRRGGLATLGAALDSALDAQTERDLGTLELVNRVLELDQDGDLQGSGVRRVASRVIAPEPGEDLGELLDFENGHMRDLVSRGIEAGKREVGL